MKSFEKRAPLLLLLAAGVSCCALSAPAQDGPKHDSLRVGLAPSLVRSVAQNEIPGMITPLENLIKDATGMAGVISVGGEALQMGRELEDKKFQLGVLHGFEFAWARQKYPDLKPLCIAFNQQRHLRAFLMVKYDSDVKELADLKGKVLALPQGSYEICRLFIDRACAAAGSDRHKFFAKIVAPKSVEAALDDVVRGKAQAAVVDGVALDGYKHDKPGLFSALKTVMSSEVFPAPVVAYREGVLDEATLIGFRDGLIHAAKNDRNRELLVLWRLTAFEPVPADYNQTLAGILKAYPPPAHGAQKVPVSPAP